MPFIQTSFFIKINQLLVNCVKWCISNFYSLRLIKSGHLAKIIIPMNVECQQPINVLVWCLPSSTCHISTVLHNQLLSSTSYRKCKSPLHTLVTIFSTHFDISDEGGIQIVRLHMAMMRKIMPFVNALPESNHNMDLTRHDSSSSSSSKILIIYGGPLPTTIFFTTYLDWSHPPHGDYNKARLGRQKLIDDEIRPLSTQMKVH